MNKQGEESEGATNNMQRFLVDLKDKGISYLLSRNRTLVKQVTVDPANRQAASISAFITLGADLDIIEQRGTPCIPNIFWSLELIQYFLQKGRSIDARNDEGDTALHLAINYGVPSIVEFLLENKADPNIPNNDGETALFTLVKKGAIDTMLIWDDEDRIKIAKKIVEKYGGDIHTANNYGESILHVAIRLNESNFNYFLDKFNGINIDIPASKFLYEITPLMVASREGKIEHCRMLITAGANIAVSDMQGLTPLHYLKPEGFSRVNFREFLIRLGADPQIRTVSGRDAYELACLGFNKVFIDNAIPMKQIQIREMVGAVAILKFRQYKRAQENWKLAMEISTKYNIPIDSHLQANYEKILKFKTILEVDLYRSAIHTIERISTGTAKLWNVLVLAKDSYPVSDIILTPADIGRLQNESFSPHQEVLTFLCEKMATNEDFGSIDEMDLRALGFWVQFISDEREHMDDTKWNNLVHIIAKLGISCLRKWIAKTGQNTVENMNTFYEICYNLLLSSPDIGNVRIRNNELLDTIIKLDPRDIKGNSFLHLSCEKNEDVLIAMMLVQAGFDVKSTNCNGHIPIQMIKASNMKYYLEIVRMMLDEGANLPVKNAYGEKILDAMLKNKHFMYQYPCITLQSSTAQYLAQKHTLYKNRQVPKRILDIIRKHFV